MQLSHSNGVKTALQNLMFIESLLIKAQLCPQYYQIPTKIIFIQIAFLKLYYRKGFNLYEHSNSFLKFAVESPSTYTIVPRKWLFLFLSNAILSMSLNNVMHCILFQS